MTIQIGRLTIGTTGSTFIIVLTIAVVVLAIAAVSTVTAFIVVVYCGEIFERGLDGRNVGQGDVHH